MPPQAKLQQYILRVVTGLRITAPTATTTLLKNKATPAAVRDLLQLPGVDEVILLSRKTGDTPATASVYRQYAGPVPQSLTPSGL